jgi:penicillin G amidase
VYDLGDPNGTLVAFAPGQSGHPASPHYDDGIRPWLAGEYVTIPMDRERVEEAVEARLLLDPAAPRE